jgi:lipid II:glycine glycyltransferase (peptidoglycan interpeptide bridge formation enzyme)
LYDNLVQRHSLTGIKAFSRPSFALQLAVPGLTMFRATHAGVTVAAQLWFLQEEVAYSHLAAANSRGYELMAAYALYSHALEYFAGRARFVAWGGGAGLDEGGRDGLAQFKRGWSNTTRTSVFLWPHFRPSRATMKLRARKVCAEGYFPAYRFGEFQ